MVGIYIEVGIKEDMREVSQRNCPLVQAVGVAVGSEELDIPKAEANGFHPLSHHNSHS